jgi:transposase-like protein
MPNDRDESFSMTRTASDELPPPDTKRWTVRRKASVVEAVLSGVITIEEVCRRYGMSVDEFLSWHNAMQRHGVQGLHINKLQNTAIPARKGAETAQRATHRCSQQIRRL